MNSFPHSIDIMPGVLLFEVGNEMDVQLTSRIAHFVHKIDELRDSGIVEIIPSYASILVIYDESITTGRQVNLLLVGTWKRTPQTLDSEPRDITTIDVVYGDTFGDDLANVSANTGLGVDEVITLHASATYTVGAVGFSPGFTYLIGMPPQLSTPRKLSPRLRVPPGSVGIGGSQTGVYALPSAGGWNLIGRSPTRLFDPESDPPVKLSLGDTVQFRQIDSADFSVLESRAPGATGVGPIEVVTPGFQTTIQDLGRYGVARYGFSTDGAADRASLVQVNRMVGNAPNTAALEITYAGPMLRFHRRMKLAIAGADLGARLNGRSLSQGRVFESMPGDELSFQPGTSASGARCYLAVKGGFDVPLVMGSASTNLTAGIGGWYGRELLKGDRLSVGQRKLPQNLFAPGMQHHTDLKSSAPFRLLPGPQRARFGDAAWNALLNEGFTVSEDANRVGLRLLGPSLAPEQGADMLSEGIVTGSIQVTGEGQAIVMLPGHATIGGYTKIASVISSDWDRLGQLAPGDTMQFCEVD